MTLEKVRSLQHGPAAVQRPWQCGSSCGCICGHFYSKDHEGSCLPSLFVHKVSPQKDARSTLLSRRKPATSTNPISQCGARVSGRPQQPDGCATHCTWMRTALLAPGQLEHVVCEAGPGNAPVAIRRRLPSPRGPHEQAQKQQGVPGGPERSGTRCCSSSASGMSQSPK